MVYYGFPMAGGSSAAFVVNIFLPATVRSLGLDSLASVEFQNTLTKVGGLTKGADRKHGLASLSRIIRYQQHGLTIANRKHGITNETRGILQNIHHEGLFAAVDSENASLKHLQCCLDIPRLRHLCIFWEPSWETVGEHMLQKLGRARSSEVFPCRPR